ncbi:hypothetical protein X801_01861 [Opisthorchis viverrini]|uniref:Uncharacterized protein n=1 Tax=Opisthorchis viverrini TaxID=6198 RepID=A0A1S8X6B7_OPIVI|nr:hypothetical protein X801_01861 [Opisthorchis viverrini]
MNPPLSFAFVSALLSCIANADHSDVECFTKMVQHVTQCAVEGLLNTDCGYKNCDHAQEGKPQLDYTDVTTDRQPCRLTWCTVDELQTYQLVPQGNFFRTCYQRFQYKPHLRVRALSKQTLLRRYLRFKP